MKIIKYRTKDNREDYKFGIKEMPGGTWRSYILWQPSYRGRADDCDSTHRLTDNAVPSKYYVCWTEPFKSENQARTISALWADLTQEYIRYGIKFGGNPTLSRTSS